MTSYKGKVFSSIVKCFLARRANDGKNFLRMMKKGSREPYGCIKIIIMNDKM